MPFAILGNFRDLCRPVYSGMLAALQKLCGHFGLCRTKSLYDGCARF